MTEQQYFQKLYDRLIAPNLDRFREALAHDPSPALSPPEGGDYQALSAVLACVERNYGFAMRLNYGQLYLWQKSVLGEVDHRRLLAAGYLVLFCCLADNILDSPRFSSAQKELLCENMDELLFRQGPRAFSLFPALGLLAMGASDFFPDQTADPLYPQRQEELARALRSERYLYRAPLDRGRPLPGEKLALLTDKSVLFEKAAFLTASYGGNTPESVKAAGLLGEVFWLVDDLCDLMEDVRMGRKNSLLFYCAHTPEPLTVLQRLERVSDHLALPVDRLERVLGELEGLISRDMFRFLLVQIWKWCHRVRAAVPGGQGAG